jgi:ketosteroid isomerase-like protein
MAAVDDLDQVI